MSQASPFSGLIDMPQTGPPPDTTDSDVESVESGGDSGGSSGGSSSGGFKSFWENHQMIMMAIGLGVLLLTAVLVFRKSSASSNAANNTTAAGGGIPTVQTSDTATAINQQNTSIEALLNAFQQFMNRPSVPTPTPKPTPTPTPTPKPIPYPIVPKPIQNPPKPVPKPAPKPTPTPVIPSAHYDTVGTWTQQNAPWNSTLWGIANHEGISLSRIEALNPGIANPNIIQPGQKIRVS